MTSNRVQRRRRLLYITSNATLANILVGTKRVLGEAMKDAEKPVKELPLVSVGPGRIGGEYQIEIYP